MEIHKYAIALDFVLSSIRRTTEEMEAENTSGALGDMSKEEAQNFIETQEIILEALLFYGKDSFEPDKVIDVLKAIDSERANQ